LKSAEKAPDMTESNLFSQREDSPWAGTPVESARFRCGCFREQAIEERGRAASVTVISPDAPAI
jgi:hypothetical protein